MSTLESLVPPLELCRKIPFPKFEGSVFVWERKNGWILERTNIDCDKEEDGFYVPAPTWQEILAEIDAEGGYCPSCRYQANMWQLDYEDDPLDGESTLPVLVDAEDYDNPATAALKLYLALLSVPSEKSVQKPQEICPVCHGTGYIKSRCDRPDIPCPHCR